MKAFAAAGILAAAHAVNTEATPTPSFLSSSYYSYGNPLYVYPEFDHKEEETPVRTFTGKRESNYRTNNIDIFAHSSSDEDDHHGHHKKHHRHHSSHSESDSSEDERPMMKKKHMMFLTGEGPEGDHCHEGDYCGKVDEPSDYTDSDYETPSEHEEEIHFLKPEPGCGGRRCARVDFDWNYLGIEGTLDIYQPHGRDPELLFDGDWDGLSPWQKHELRIKSLPKYISDPEDNSDIRRPDWCGNTGSTLAWVGTARADKYGGGHIRTFKDDICLEDFIGNAVEIRGTYSNWQSDHLAILACGNVVEVACPEPEYEYRW